MRIASIDIHLMAWLICALFGLMQSVHATHIQQTELYTYMIDTNNVFAGDNNINDRPSIDEYLAMRKEFIDNEVQYGFGADINLNKREKKANAIIMAAKEAEYANGTLSPQTFTPSRHIFETLATIKQSKLFQIIQKMPKGGVLHAHDTALCSADYVVSLTYWPHLWQLSYPNGTDIVNFLFSSNQPNTTAENHEWRRVDEIRQEMGAEKYDKYVRTYFTLYDESVKDPKIQFGDINEVWNKFKGIFGNVHNLLTYAPIWKAYYKQALQEMLDDGVQYLELRSTLPPVSQSRIHLLRVPQHFLDSVNEFLMVSFVFFSQCAQYSYMISMAQSIKKKML